MSGSKWWKMVLSGARGKYCEIISKNFKSNYFNKKAKQNKTTQNETKLNLNTNKIKYNKFGFPVIDDN